MSHPAFDRAEFALGFWQDRPTPQLRTVKVVKEFDTARFFELSVDLMTRPAPVIMSEWPRDGSAPGDISPRGGYKGGPRDGTVPVGCGQRE